MELANTNACRKTYLGETINDSLGYPIRHLHLKISDMAWLSISNPIYITMSSSIHVLVRDKVVNPLTIRL